MAELESKKFIYKKNRMDWMLVMIILFTFICFAAIFYGLRYFENTETRVDNGQDQIADLVQNKAILERQINDYLNDPDFSEHNSQ